TPTEPGNNQFRQNGRYDINSSAAKRVTISAVGNQVAADRSIGNIDFAGTTNVASNSGVGSRRGGFSERATNETSALGSKPARTGVESNYSLPANPDTPVSQPALQVVEIPVPLPESESAPVQKKPAQKPKKPSVFKPSEPAPQNQSSKVATSTTKPKPEATKAPATNNKQSLAANSQTEVRIPVSRSQPPTKGDTITRGLPTLKPAAVNPNELLPVPDGDIPSSSDRPARIAAVSSHNSSQVGSLRYRVLVEAENAPTQEKVRSLVPGSFRVSAKGKIIMQAGAFSDRSKADEIAQLLTSNGLKAKVEQMN
ncbi:MAG: hypothetical protein ACRCZS_25900, partial [Chroococcidiopsis sp.]